MNCEGEDLFKSEEFVKGQGKERRLLTGISGCDIILFNDVL